MTPPPKKRTLLARAVPNLEEYPWRFPGVASENAVFEAFACGPALQRVGDSGQVAGDPEVSAFMGAAV
jgi:hypothetical protein